MLRLPRCLSRAAEVLTAPGFADTAYGAALRMYLMCENYLLADELQDTVLFKACVDDWHEEFLNTVNNGSAVKTFE